MITGELVAFWCRSSVDRLPDGTTRLHERRYSDIEFDVAIDESMFLPGS